MSPGIVEQLGKMTDALNRRNSALPRVRQKSLAALAVVLAFGLCSVYAADDADQDAAKSGQNAKKMALIHLLSRAGKNEEAAAGMRSLYPSGPPTGGDPALEYYRIIGNTSRGWNEARIGFGKLVQATPNDRRYRLALARHLTARPATRRAGIQALAALAKTKQPDAGKQHDIDRQPSVDKQPSVTQQQILDAWRNALVALDHSPDHIGLYRDYLAVDPGNAAVRDALAIAQRTEAERQPWLLRDKADALLKQGHADEAMATLKNALQLAPKNPWVRFDLARLYHKGGLAKQGRNLIDEGLTAAPDDPDMLYACALYLGLLDEADAALRLLDKIPAAARTPSMLRLRQKMAIQSQTQQAKVLAQNGRRADALAVLEHAETDAGDDAELVNDVADAWLALGETSRGMALLQRLLAQQSAPPVDLSLRYATLLNWAERDDELAPLLAQLDSTKELSDEKRADVRYLQASLAARRADKLRHAGDYAAASAALAPALKHDPENTDLLMAQARVYSAVHQPEQARAIYQRILERSQRDMSVQLAPAGNPMLNFDYGIFAPGDVGIRLALIGAMSEMGDQAAARRQIETVLANTTDDDFDTRLSVAGWYIDANNIVAARNELEIIAGIQNLPPSAANTMTELREAVTIRIADALTKMGNPALAHKTLAPFLAAKPDQVQLLLADARAYHAERQWKSTATIYAHVLQLDKTNSEARDGLIESLIALGNRAAALQHMDEWAADSMANDLPTRLKLSGLFIDIEEYSHAEKLIAPLLSAYPDNLRALGYAAQIAHRTGRLDDEIGYLKKSIAAEQAERFAAQNDTQHKPDNSIASENIGVDELGSPKKINRDWQEKKLAKLIDRRSRWISSAIDIHSRSGTRGMSQFNSVEIPLEYKAPWHRNDEVFFRVDEVILNSGYVDPRNTSFGSQLLCQPYCSTALSQQSWAGQSLTAGYERNNLQADIGVTPLNFPVSNIVGGIRHDGDFGKLSYSIEASRRPVTASLLSFAGTQDPRTGVVWGGVVATGGRLGVSLDEGKTFGLWSTASLQGLTGRNVLSNKRMQLMAGGQWRIINEENRLLSLGLTGMYLHHAADAGEYTFGHGGYFSPQHYRSLSLPVTYERRYPRFSYVLRASISASQTQTQAAPYFPTDGVMQAQATALATNTPMYSAGTSHGTGYSLKCGWEYQVEPKLFAGGVLSMDRSDSYSPNRVLFYLRYSIDHPGAQPVFMPPEPIEPSSQR